MPQTMKFKTADLLRVIEKNRFEHRDIFLKALDGYRIQAVKELETMLEEAKAGKRIRRSVQLVEPMDMTKEYDRVLRMLGMTTAEEIELNQTEFAQYVLDDWSWKEQFTHSNKPYVGA